MMLMVFFNSTPIFHGRRVHQIWKHLGLSSTVKIQYHFSTTVFLWDVIQRFLEHIRMLLKKSIRSFHVRLCKFLIYFCGCLLVRYALTLSFTMIFQCGHIQFEILYSCNTNCLALVRASGRFEYICEKYLCCILRHYFAR